MAGVCQERSGLLDGWAVTASNPVVSVDSGLSAAARKISWSTSITWVLGTWGVYVLIKMGWAAMFGQPTVSPPASLGACWLPL